MKNSCNRVTPFLLLSLVGCACVPHESRAAFVTWANAAGGSSMTLTNWSPQQLPAAPDDVSFLVAGAYPVTWAAGSTGVVTNLSLANNADVTLTLDVPLAVSSSLSIGTAAASGAVLRLASGTLTTGATRVGFVSITLPGILEIASPTASLNCSSVSVGTGGTGNMTISNGGTLLSSGGMLVSGSNTTGTITVSGVSESPVQRSRLELTGPGVDLHLGASRGGVLNVSNGALVSVADRCDLYSIGGTASVVTVGGSLSGFDATLNIGGDLNLGNNPNNIARGRLNVNPGAVVTVGGLTTLGDASGGTCFLEQTGGRFETQSLTIVTNGTLTRSGGTMVLNGGTITAPSGISQVAACTLEGSGTINANVTNAGRITATGSGLTFTGNLSDDGVGISGTRMTFANGASYTGNGILNCEIQSLTGSTFNPSGFTTMGKISSTNGVNFDGVMNITNTTIECMDSNGARIGGTVNLNNGELSGLTGLRFEGGTLPRLTGNGSISDDCTMNGRIEPGIASGDQTGHIDFVTLTFGNTGSLLIDIEGDQPSQFDSITTIDEFDLSSLPSLFVNRVGNYYPPRGTVYRIITGSRFGEFGTVFAPGFNVNYLPNGVELVFDKLCNSIDFNNDESLFDPQDIDAFLSVFSEGPCIPEQNTCNDIDFNNDGSLFDPIDIDAFLSMFGEGPCI